MAMENKEYLERAYRTNYDCAVKYIQNKNWKEAKTSLEKAAEALVKLVPLTYSAEREKYRTKVNGLTDLLKDVRARVDAEKPVQATGGNSNNRPTSNNNNNSNNRSNSNNNSGGGKSESSDALKEKIPVEEALAKLNELIGLSEVKREVESITAELEMIAMRSEFGLKGTASNHHLIFGGSPGTGKTTVARIMADILYSLGAIEKGQLVEVGREDLVAGYVGQTGKKTQEKIDEAKGGVLFIDEIYRLGEGGENDFGKEAVGCLLKAVEDCRDEFVVILAGYEERMDDFFRLNPGLVSRFPNRVHFTDYTPDEMFKIFESMCKKNQYVMGEQAQSMVKANLNTMYETRDENFGNARSVRNLFEKIIKNMNLRLYRLKASGVNVNKEMLMTILPEDIK